MPGVCDRHAPELQQSGAQHAVSCLLYHSHA